jgi:hypothetical protein
VALVPHTRKHASAELKWVCLLLEGRPRVTRVYVLWWRKAGEAADPDVKLVSLQLLLCGISALRQEADVTRTCSFNLTKDWPIL